MHLPVVKEAFQMQSDGQQQAKLLKLFSLSLYRRTMKLFFKGMVEKAILYLVCLSRAAFTFPV